MDAGFVVNQALYVSKDRNDIILNSVFRWETLADPDAPPPTREAGLASLYTEIRNTVGEEVKIVEHVFPNPGTVMQIFLQRVFAQSVSE